MMNVQVRRQGSHSIVMEGPAAEVWSVVARIKDEGAVEVFPHAPVDLTAGVIQLCVDLRPILSSSSAQTPSPGPESVAARRLSLWRLSAALAFLGAFSAAVWFVVSLAVRGISLVFQSISTAFTWVASHMTMLTGYAIAFVVVLLAGRSLVRFFKSDWYVPYSAKSRKRVKSVKYVDKFDKPVKKQTFATKRDAPEMDRLTSDWLRKLRDPNTTQSVGMWRGQSSAFDSDFDPYTEDWDARCGVGHLLDAHNPSGWRSGGNGKKHKSYRAMKRKYGSWTINTVQSMNDRGVSLEEQAKYVEGKVRKRLKKHR